MFRRVASVFVLTLTAVVLAGSGESPTDATAAAPMVHAAAPTIEAPPLVEPAPEPELVSQQSSELQLLRDEVKRLYQKIDERDATILQLQQQISRLTTPAQVPAQPAKATPVRYYYAPQQSYGSCGPGGCGSSGGLFRSGLFGRRR